MTWDDGFFIHFVLHVIAGDEEGFLGYGYEDDPSRWSWQVHDVAAQEVSLLSDQWFYGENLVSKIRGAEPGADSLAGPGARYSVTGEREGAAFGGYGAGGVEERRLLFRRIGALGTAERCLLE